MTSSTALGKDLEPLSVFGELSADGLIGALYGSDAQFAVLWTFPVGGVRSVVATEIRPRSAVPFTDAELVAVSEKWLSNRAEELLREMPKEPQALSASTARGLPFREALRLCAPESESRVTAAASVAMGYVRAQTLESGEIVGLTAQELDRFDLLQDALDYVRALDQGFSPAHVIAERRTISVRTAEGRIARAREVGYLTPASGRKASGELTPLALDIIDRISRSKEEAANG